ncbi:MAG: hypothetical protein K6E83_07845 [Clostridium sp.]|nr:hypothetical protein [Clostridium sp.]
MKNQWIKRISIALAAVFLLAVLPMSALADKGAEPKVGAGVSEVKATNSDMVRQTEESSETEHEKATPSNVKKPEVKEEEDDLLKLEDGETALVNDLIPKETAAETTAETEAAEVLPKTEVKSTEEDITGLWTIDDITSYQFSEDGTGALILPEHEYPFDYTLEDDRLTLEFESSRIRKTVFTVALEEGTLTLVKKEDAGTAEYVLEKTDD